MCEPIHNKRNRKGTMRCYSYVSDGSDSKITLHPVLTKGGEIGTGLGECEGRQTLQKETWQYLPKLRKYHISFGPSKSASEQKSYGYTYLCANNKYTRTPLTKY